MNSLFVLAASLSIGISNSWYKNEKKRQLAEQEKLQAELAYLKSQINPHFLFNSLNNIYSLANDKSDLAPEAIVKLSSLLRYMLYQAKKEMVLLEEEISHIKNYIDLQKLRLFDEIEISLTIKGDIKKYSIEPLLLIPFVENTFKHGVSYQQKSTITIEIQVSHKTLKLVTINPIVSDKGTKQKGNKGIGLENVKRRLELLYADSHTLKINTDNGTYNSELLIWLK